MKPMIEKSIRLFAVLALACSLSATPQFAQAEGGGLVDEVKPTSKTSTKAPKPRVQSKPKPRQTATNRTRTSPAKKKAVKKSRPRAPQIVETAPSGQPPLDETRFVANEVIVRFQLSSTAGSRNRAINTLGLTHLRARTFFLPGVTVHRYRLPLGLDVRTAITRLEASGAVVNAQPNYLYTLQQSGDSIKIPQYGNDKVELRMAHARTQGGNARIAIIDTAVDDTHSEFSAAQIASFDVTDDGKNVDPHGTSIAGILASTGKLTGVAPAADIISIAAFSRDASGKNLGNTWTILEATNVALEQKADILNMSFAGPADPLLKQAMDGAKKRNILPVAAAGNEGPEAGTLFPAGYETVIAVTAIDSDNNIYSDANSGAHVDMAAPGVGLLVLGNSSGFRTSSGTSLATAYVSGIAALTLSANPKADYKTLRSLLENSATDLGDPGRDSVFGAGLPNAAVAIGGLVN